MWHKGPPRCCEVRDGGSRWGGMVKLGLPKSLGQGDVLSVAVQSAAVWHDAGKATRFFQDRLKRGGIDTAPIRHELTTLFAMQRPGDPFDGVIRETTEAFRQQVEQAAGNGTFPSFPLLPPEHHSGDHWPLAEALVATHHRLPAGGVKGYTCREHVATRAEGGYRVLDAERFRAGIAACGAAAAKVELPAPPAGVPEHGSCDRLEWYSALFLWGRLALMAGDQSGSAADISCSPSTGKEPSPDVVANADRPGGRPAQSLEGHQTVVAERARMALEFLAAGGDGLPALGADAASELMKQGKGRFLWQERAVGAAKTLAGPQKGVFAVICAGTGAGKTRACGKLAYTLAGDAPVRFSTLLGLQSLTMQTGTAYRRECGLPETTVATLIGSSEVRELHRAGEGDELDVEVEGPTFRARRWLEPILFTEDRKRLLCAPVLVCTIDYLMQAADWRRARHVLPQLRIATSDIILDEIDGYDLTAYPALGRLCYLVGLFGRKLILSSATAMPELIRPLQQAYEEGWRGYAALAGCLPEVSTLFVSDRVGPVVGTGLDGYAEFAASVARDTVQAPSLRRGVIGRVERGGVAAAVGNAVHRLFAEEENYIEHDGMRVSVGLVRFAQTKDALKVARVLSGVYRNEITNRRRYIKTLFYHARMPLAVRAWIERRLDEALRRGGENDPMPTSELMAPIIEEAKAAGCDKVLLIVVATPVEEVGRDHDFDWAVIEPSSSRSIIQCAGRVNRHRRRPVERPNIVVLDTNCRELELGAKSDRERRQKSLEGNDCTFCRPGYEFRRFRAASGRTIAHTMTEMAASLCSFPTAHACLAPRADVDELPQAERREVAAYLAEHLTAGFAGMIPKMGTEHFERHPFRDRGQDDGVAYYWRDGGRWYWRSDEGVEFDQEFAEQPEAVPFGEGFLLGGSIDGIVAEMAGALGAPLVTAEQRRAFDRRYLAVRLPGAGCKWQGGPGVGLVRCQK